MHPVFGAHKVPKVNPPKKIHTHSGGTWNIPFSLPRGMFLVSCLSDIVLCGKKSFLCLGRIYILCWSGEKFPIFPYLSRSFQSTLACMIAWVMSQGRQFSVGEALRYKSECTYREVTIATCALELRFVGSMRRVWCDDQLVVASRIVVVRAFFPRVPPLDVLSDCVHGAIFQEAGATAPSAISE